MSELSGSRTSVTIQCSHAFKARVVAYQKRHGHPSISEAMISLAGGVLKDDEKLEQFIADTDAIAAADDYQMLIELSRDGKQIP